MRTGWLIALVVAVLLAGAAVFVAMLPLVSCPQDIHGAPEKGRCYRCGDRGRLTLLDRWIHGDYPLEDWEGIEISEVQILGSTTTPQPESEVEAAGIRPGATMTERKKELVAKKVMDTDRYNSIIINVYPERMSPGKAIVQIIVAELDQ